MNAEDLVLNFKKGMANPSKTERRRAIESVGDVIRAAALDDAAGSAYEIERRPRCGSAAVVKKGKSKNGEQRYLCRGCGAAGRTVARQLARGACGSRVRDMFNVAPPYMDYWAAPAARRR